MAAPILAGAAEANHEKQSEHVRDIMIWSHRRGYRFPFYYQIGPEAVYTYFKEIADNSPIDMTLYNIPLFASPIDVDTVAVWQMIVNESLVSKTPLETFLR